MDGIIANEKLDDTFQMNTIHMLMVNSDVPSKDIKAMAKQMEDVDGVNYVIGLNTIKGDAIPDSAIPDSLKKQTINDNWQLILISSKYKVASDEVNSQISELQSIAKSYDSGSMKKLLIVYYSWSSGNTKKIAEMLQSAAGADIEAIETVQPYAGSYEDVVEQAQKEVKADFQPEIKKLSHGFSGQGKSLDL